MNGFAPRSHSLRNNASQSIHSVWHISADVEDLIVREGNINGACDNGGNITDMSESALLLAVTENSHRLTLHELVHEDADHVAISVADILPFAIDVVGTKDDVVETKHLVGDFQLSLHGELGDAIGVFRHGNHI